MRQATSPEISAMIIAGHADVGLNTADFSSISARRGGVSTAIEAGVSDAFLWMRSRHSQDIALCRTEQSCSLLQDVRDVRPETTVTPRAPCAGSGLSRTDMSTSRDFPFPFSCPPNLGFSWAPSTP